MFDLYKEYKKEEYIQALVYFGFSEKQAEKNYKYRKETGTICGINDLVYNHKLNSKTGDAQA